MAPINQIPPEVLSLIPDYSDEDYHGSCQGQITLTHVCRSWRDIFTSRSSLWAGLDLTSMVKTRTFIQRSKFSPLDVYASNLSDEIYLDDALSLIIPHIPRLRSLTFRSNAIPDTLRNFHCHAPLLEDLEIVIYSPQTEMLDIPLLNGDLQSLRRLNLVADIICYPRRTRQISVFLASPAPKEGSR